MAYTNTATGKPTNHDLLVFATICSSLFDPRCSGVTRVGVTRGGNWRCHSFFLQNTDDLFSYQFYGVTPIFSSHNWRPFCSSLISLGCHSPGGCHPWPFYLSVLVSPVFFVNKFSHNFFSFGCHLWHPTSPSDVTARLAKFHESSIRADKHF